MLKTAVYMELQPFNFTFVAECGEAQNTYAGGAAKFLPVKV